MTIAIRRLLKHAFIAALMALACATGSCDRSDDIQPGVTRITWLVPMQLDRPLLEKLARQFRADNPDIDLRLTFVPAAQYQTKLKTLIASGHPPDMFYCGDVWVAYYRPFLLDLTPLFTRDAAEIDMKDIYPGVLSACETDGKYLFIPRWFSVALLYYNRRIFDDAHEPYPTSDWTWDSYIAAAQRYTASARTVKPKSGAARSSPGGGENGSRSSGKPAAICSTPTCSIACSTRRRRMSECNSTWTRFANITSPPHPASARTRASPAASSRWNSSAIPATGPCTTRSPASIGTSRCSPPGRRNAIDRRSPSRRSARRKTRLIRSNAGDS